MSVRIVLVDDHRMLREGLCAILSAKEGYEVVGEAEDGASAVAAALDLAPDLVVMDVGLPGMNGIEACRRITKERPEARVIALSTHSDKRYVLNMIAAGASGYVLKEAASEELIRAVDAVVHGGHYLSPQITGVVFEPISGKPVRSSGSSLDVLGPRERQVLQLLAEGKTSKSIAEKLDLSIKTIETHRRNISQKLGLKSIAELTKYAVREGMTTIE
jgi:DNA-binding NarL/FixJ family response regulator